MSVRTIRSASLMKAGPFLASRQAAVAMARVLCTPWSYRARGSASAPAKAVLDRVGGEQSRGLNLAAKPAQRFLVEQRRRAAGKPLVDDKPHGIRSRYR